MSGTIAITMAGMGSRFTKAGYTRPKYEVMANGRPLFDWSLLSLTAFRDAGWRFHFIARAGLDAEAYIAGRVQALGISDHTVTCIDAVTDGQATTAMIAAEHAPQDQPFAIYNIDTYVTPGVMVPPDPASCAGWMPCFDAPGDGWSFARTDAGGNVVEVREKDRISNNATVGLYWFRSAAGYAALYRDYYAIPENLEKGERYVAPLYNALIALGEPVRVGLLEVGGVGMLGTPDQVADFIANPPPSARRLAVSS